MAQKPSSDDNRITFNGNNATSEGTATPGTPGQSSSSPGQSVTFNHNTSQSSSTNNLNQINPTRPETGGFHPYPGNTPAGSTASEGATTNHQGQSVHGTDGQSANAVGENATSVQSSSTTVTSGQTSTVTQPGQTVIGASTSVTGADGQGVNSGSDMERRPASDNDDPTYNVPANPDPDTMYATGTTTSVEGQSVQGADGQSASAVGQSATSNQASSTIGSSETIRVTQPGQTVTGASSSVPGTDGQGANSGTNTGTNDSGQTTTPPGEVTHIDIAEDLSVGQPSGNTQNVSTGGLHMTNNPDGSHSMTSGSMTMSEDANGNKTISNGSFNMTKSSDGTKTISNSPAGSGSDMERRSASDNDGSAASSGTFPTHSTYDNSLSASDIQAKVTSSLANAGWGSSDHVPPDPANGVFGVDRNKLTNPFDTKNTDDKG